VFVDQCIKINIHGIANNGCANIHHICRVLYIEVSDPYFIQGSAFLYVTKDAMFLTIVDPLGQGGLAICS
jgi:hypothetical protein